MWQSSIANGDNLKVAIGAIVITTFALALGDALIKNFSTDFTLWQIFVFRSAIAISILLIIIKIRDRSAPLFPENVGWVVVRSLMLTLMWVAYYASLPKVDLSVAAAAYYTLPLFLTLFSSLLIGDRIGKNGWVAVGVGFVGVLCILQPQADDFNAYALLPLLSAMLYALSMILTRTRCRNENVFVLSLNLNVTFLIVGLLLTLLLSFLGLQSSSSSEVSEFSFLRGSWTAMGRAEWLVIMLLAAAVIIGSVGAAIAYQNGPPSVVGTFDFSYVGFAVIWGILLFDETPDVPTLAGIGLIVAAGMMSLRSAK